MPHEVRADPLLAMLLPLLPPPPSNPQYMPPGIHDLREAAGGAGQPADGVPHAGRGHQDHQQARQRTRQRRRAQAGEHHLLHQGPDLPTGISFPQLSLTVTGIQERDSGRQSEDSTQA